MNLAEVKELLRRVENIAFKLPSGEWVPNHFHVTEVGRISKYFIDCGGTIRYDEVVNLQLWNANDYDHRLHPEKLLKIIELSEKTLRIDDSLIVEVEYQGQSIEKYGLDFDGKNFLLTGKRTGCLAGNNCANPLDDQKVKLSDLNNESFGTPKENCC